MEDKTFVEKDIGPETKLIVSYENGQMSIGVKNQGSIGGADLRLWTDAAKLVDAITDVIPGDWDDNLLDDLAGKLLAKKTGA